MGKKKFKIQPKNWPKEYTFEEFKRLNPNINENVLINYYNKYLQEYAENYSRHTKHFEDNKKLLSNNLQEVKDKYDDPTYFQKLYYGNSDPSAAAGRYADLIPTDIVGLIAHYDMSSPDNYVIGTEGNPSTLAVIKDITGNGFDIRNGVASIQPELHISSSGDTPQVSFRNHNRKYYFGIKGGTGNTSFTVLKFNTLNTTDDFDYSNNTINITPAHNLKTGDEVFYYPFGALDLLAGFTNDRSSLIPGGIKETYNSASIADGSSIGVTYFAIKVDEDKIKLASSLNNANAGTPINLSAPDSEDTRGVLIKNLNLGQEQTIFYVVRNNEVKDPGGFYGTGIIKRNLHRTDGTLGFRWGLDNDVITPTGSNIHTFSGSMVETAPMIQTFRMKDSASLGLSTFPFGRDWEKNGASVNASAAPSTTYKGVTGLAGSGTKNKDHIRVLGNDFNRNDALDGFGDYNVFELIMYNRRLSERECVQIENYLSKKYNINLLSTRNITLGQYGR